MTEQLISLETAILAHEKGFVIVTERYWLYNDKIGLCKEWQGMPPYVADGCDNIYRPSQSLLQKWLRDERGIVIWVRPGANFSVFSWYLDGDDIPHRLNRNGYNSYEEALEDSLLEALKLL